MIRSIQGLRALAVSAVVVNHYFPYRVPGGFIGVDVFFVVSGFLMTKNIITDLKADRFSFVRFYSRRARRLLPAAMLVLIFSLLVTLVCLPVALQSAPLNDIAAASLYVLNWRLIFKDTQYFADHTNASIVLHYWSLSIEEQFYFVWPLILVVTILASRIIPKSTQRPRAFVAVTLAITLASFAWTVSTGRSQDAIYFDLRARAWEFGLGALTSLLAPHVRTARFSASVLSTLGWGNIALSALLLSDRSQVPGWDALAPCLAACAIIWAGDSVDPRFLQRLIVSCPVQRLGDISYSLYLWHWPILAVAPYALGLQNVTEGMGVALIATSVIAAGLTKVWIEDPWRLHGPASMSNALRKGLSLVSLSTVVALSSAALAMKGPQRGVQVAEKLYRLSLNPGQCFGGNAVLSGAICPNVRGLDEPDYVLQAYSNQIKRVPNGSVCQNERRDERVNPCSFGAREGEERTRLALFGDSHAGMWAAGLAAFAEQRGLRIDMYTASACPPTLSDDVFDKYMPPSDRPYCVQWRQEAIKRIASDSKVKYVMTSGYSLVHQRLGTDGQWTTDDGSGYVTAWKKFLDAGKKVIVIDDVPTLPFYFADCLALNHVKVEKCTYERSPNTELSPYAKAAAKVPSKDIVLISFEHVLCDILKCYPVVGGIPAYMDKHHVSAPFARSVAVVLHNAIARIDE
jgi:peptidoglycan/LPS O-acetylase OafA/YrhL